MAQQTWEYGHIFASANQGGGMTVNGGSQNVQSTFAAASGSPLDDCLTKLGDDGWKLVGTFSEATRTHLLFERPKP